MKEIIENDGKKYETIDDGPFDSACEYCCFKNNEYMCLKHMFLGFPDCFSKDIHFELVEETNQIE